MRHLHQNPNALHVIGTSLKTLRVFLIYRMCERQMDIKNVVDGGMPRCCGQTSAREPNIYGPMSGGRMRDARQNARSISERVAYLDTKK